MKKIDLVCIVEDDPIHLFLTKKHIELSGCVKKILICKNGKEAFDTLIKMFQNNEMLPHTIFLDINMPIWDGWQFLEEFIKIPITQKIKIYILTSSNDEEDYKKAVMFNLQNQYLIKPLDRLQLLEILSSAD